MGRCIIVSSRPSANTGAVCRADLVAFAVEALASKGEKPARHHIRICREVEALVRGTVRGLIILAPPGSAKTTYVSRISPAWLFVRPNTRIIAVSHTAELAETNSTAVQRFIRDNAETLGYALANDNCGHCHTTNARVSRFRRGRRGAWVSRGLYHHR